MSEPVAAQEPTPATRPSPPDDGGRERSDEARRYRLRLRDAEAERDALAVRVGRFQCAEVERIARDERAAVPGDVLGPLAFDDLRGEDGELDPDAVREQACGVLAERPTWREPVPDLGSGARSERPALRSA